MEKLICDKPATYAYTWPGRDQSYICLRHAVYLRNVANAIGLRLQLTPVADDSTETCRQSVPIGDSADTPEQF
jgi:hypothetical protein